MINNTKAEVESFSCLTLSVYGEVEAVLFLVTRGPPSLSVVLLGVGRVTAVGRGVGAPPLTSLATSPLSYGAPCSCHLASHPPSLSS